MLARFIGAAIRRRAKDTVDVEFVLTAFVGLDGEEVFAQPFHIGLELLLIRGAIALGQEGHVNPIVWIAGLLHLEGPVAFVGGFADDVIVIRVNLRAENRREHIVLISTLGAHEQRLLANRQYPDSLKA